MRSRKMSLKKGFTLIELLVVIAIIALLLSIIIPALKSAKQLASGAVCLANEKQLGLSFVTYAGDHKSLIPDGDTSGQTGNLAGFEFYNRSPVGESGNYRVHCWVGQPINANKQPSNFSLDDKIRGFVVGSLWSYLEAPKVYHCPMDNRFTKTLPNGEMMGYRSYSIGKTLSKRYPGNPGEVESEITKISQFVNPSGKIVFLEEAEKEYGWNNKTWNMDLVNPIWGDPFAIFHNDSSTFAFADGHAGRRKWLEKQTRKMAEAGAKNWSAVDPDSKTHNDWDWFKKAYIPGRKPSGI
jgi:prepilin-type N-terminal cleavage/methylation domain-containing protein/prepilin-type processing-associated H-X9-DG protein